MEGLGVPQRLEGSRKGRKAGGFGGYAAYMRIG